MDKKTRVSFAAAAASKNAAPSQVQKVAASLAGEYALALLWPLSTVIYAWLSPLLATLVGALVLWPLACYIVFSACPRKMPPRASPAFILVDGFYLQNAPQPGEPRYERRMQQSRLFSVEGPWLALVRLAIHWLGAFSGYYLLRLSFGDELRVAVEQGLAVVWSQLGAIFNTADGGAMYLLVLHVASQAAIGLHQMRFFSVSLQGQESYFKSAMVASLVYPWAAPHFSPGSFLWVTHSAGLSSLTLMTASFASCVLSAVLCVFMYEGTVGRSAAPHSRPSSVDNIGGEKNRNQQTTEINELD